MNMLLAGLRLLRLLLTRLAGLAGLAGLTGDLARNLARNLALLGLTLLLLEMRRLWLRHLALGSTRSPVVVETTQRRRVATVRTLINGLGVIPDRLSVLIRGL